MREDCRKRMRARRDCERRMECYPKKAVWEKRQGDGCHDGCEKAKAGNRRAAERRPRQRKLPQKERMEREGVLSGETGC